MPIDVSEHVCGANIRHETELESILRREGFASHPYTFLLGGHFMDRLQGEETDDSIRQPAILAVPKDPVVRVLFENREWMSSIGSYNGTVRDLKVILGQSLSFITKISSERLMLMQLSGKP